LVVGSAIFYSHDEDKLINTYITSKKMPITLDWKLYCHMISTYILDTVVQFCLATNNQLLLKQPLS